MAGRARFVATVKGCRQRNHRFACLVALHAGCRLGGELVAPMAVGASTAEPGPPVLDFHLLVAFVAFQNGFFDWFVWVVTRFARH